MAHVSITLHIKAAKIYVFFFIVCDPLLHRYSFCQHVLVRVERARVLEACGPELDPRIHVYEKKHCW